jgi:hypothetical protein
VRNFVKCRRCGFEAIVTPGAVHMDPIAMQRACEVAKERRGTDQSPSLTPNAAIECPEFDESLRLSSDALIQSGLAVQVPDADGS